MKDKPGKVLDLDRFRTIVDAYGADPSKWPEAERDAALSFLGSASEAAPIVEQAAQLDTMLESVPLVEPSSELERMVAAIPEKSRSTSNRIEFETWRSMVSLTTLWKPTLAATLAIVLGIITGVATAEPMNISNGSTDWEDFASLAFVTDLDQELVP